MLRGRGQSGDHSEERAELFRMDPAQAGEGRAGRGKAGLQSAAVRCLAASITARTTSGLRTVAKKPLIYHSSSHMPTQGAKLSFAPPERVNALQHSQPLPLDSNESI